MDFTAAILVPFPPQPFTADPSVFSEVQIDTDHVDMLFSPRVSRGPDLARESMHASVG